MLDEMGNHAIVADADAATQHAIVSHQDTGAETHAGAQDDAVADDRVVADFNRTELPSVVLGRNDSDARRDATSAA